MSRWSAIVKTAGPAVLLAMAAASLWGYLQTDARLSDPGVFYEQSIERQLHLGVYVSPDDERTLSELTPDFQREGSSPWQAQVDAGPSGAAAEISYGPLSPEILGDFDVGGQLTGQLHGTLKRPVTVLFLFPRGASFPAGSQALKETLWQFSQRLLSKASCARWTEGGTQHEVKPRIVSGPYVMALARCDIPAISSATNLSISMFASLRGDATRTSFYGDASAAIINPDAPNFAFDAGQPVPGVSDEMMRTLQDQPYDLRVGPRTPLQIQSAYPDASSGAFTMRQWVVAPGNAVFVQLVDAHRRNEIALAEQVLLLLAGMFFGLLPASFGPAGKAWRSLRQRPNTS